MAIEKGKALVPAKERAAEEDYAKARETFRKLIEHGMASLERAAAVADQDDHPDSFEAVSKLIRSVSEVSGKLMALADRESGKENPKHHGRRTLPPADGAPPELDGPQTVNNFLVTTTTPELQAQIKEIQAGVEIKRVDG